MRRAARCEPGVRPKPGDAGKPVEDRWISQNGTKLVHMRVIAISRLREFWERNPAARKPLADWLKEVSAAQWRVPQDIKNRYATASFLPGRRVVFNIKGNDFRLVVAVAYVQQALFIKFVGTHAEYDRINATNVEPPP